MEPPERAVDPQSPQSAVRFVDEQSGRNDVLGCVQSLSTMTDAVSRLLEGGRPGTRFPLIRLVGRARPLSNFECEALAREIVRLRSVLATQSVETLRPCPPEVASDPALSAAAPLDPLPEPFPRLNGNGAPKTLADAFAWPLFVLEHVARLGAASRRGAHFETGPADAFASTRTPLYPHAPAPTPYPSAFSA